MKKINLEKLKSAYDYNKGVGAAAGDKVVKETRSKGADHLEDEANYESEPIKGSASSQGSQDK
jgi:hypothetical protein